MKKIKVRVKEKALPNLKGFDICRTIYKEFAEDVKKHGETQCYYNHHHLMNNDKLFVGVIKYGDKNYFLVAHNDKITSCIEM